MAFLAILSWLIAPLIMSFVSVAYWKLDQNSDKVRRFWCAAHGAIASVMYFLALLVWELGRSSNLWAGWPWLTLYILPLGSVIYALIRFRGPLWLHTVQLPNLVCMLYSALASTMAMTGDWL